MAEPIEYQVLANLQAALVAMSVATGYHYTVAAGAVRLDPNYAVEELVAPDGVRPFLFIQPTSETWQIASMPNGLKLTWPVTIHWVHDSDPTNDNSRALVFFRGCADIERAVVFAVTQGFDAGGLPPAVIVRRVYQPAEGALVWAAVDLSVTIHRTYGAPDA